MDYTKMIRLSNAPTEMCLKGIIIYQFLTLHSSSMYRFPFLIITIQINFSWSCKWTSLSLDVIKHNENQSNINSSCFKWYTCKIESEISEMVSFNCSIYLDWSRLSTCFLLLLLLLLPLLPLLLRSTCHTNQSKADKSRQFWIVDYYTVAHSIY